MGESVIGQAEKKFFLEEGYLILEDVLDHKDLEPVIHEITSEIDHRATRMKKSGELSDTYATKPFEKRLADISRESAKIAISIWNGILHGPAIFNLITHPKLLDLAAYFCGEEVIASSVYRLRPKIPNFGYGEVPAHQDSGYFEPYCDDSLIITMWIPLVDTDIHNGCLYVLPRSHQGPVVAHTMHETGKYLAIDQKVQPKTEPVFCPVPKGGALLLTNKTIHGSLKNSSDHVRWSMDLRYQSASLPTNANITRLNHEVSEDSEAGVPSACYPPDADFLVRSKKRPDEVIRTPEEFKLLRERYSGKELTNRFGVHWKEMGVDEAN